MGGGEGPAHVWLYNAEGCKAGDEMQGHLKKA